MDSFLYRIAYAIGKAIKDWPLATLIVVCITVLLAIPIAMGTKRVLDNFWLGRDEYISMLSEHNGLLKKEVNQWKDAASKAQSAEIHLVHRIEDLHSRLIAFQSQLSDARDNEAELARRLSDGHRLVQQVEELRGKLASAQRQLRDAQARETELMGRPLQQCESEPAPKLPSYRPPRWKPQQK